MDKSIAMKVGSALTKIEFLDEDGICLGFLKINLTDPRLVGRMQDCAAFFENYQEEGSGPDALNKALVERFCYALGYDCSNTLFGVLNPTDLFDDGTMFAIFVLNKIGEKFSDGAKQQAEARAKALRKHTDKYQK